MPKSMLLVKNPCILCLFKTMRGYGKLWSIKSEDFQGKDSFD